MVVKFASSVALLAFTRTSLALHKEPQTEEVIIDAHGVISASVPEAPGLLSATSPCMANPHPWLEEQRVRTSATWQGVGFDDANPRHLKFFLYRQGAFDFSDMVQCYFDAIGTRDEVDLHVLPGDAEHLTDVRLLKHMDTHEARTWDPAEANIHVIGAELNTAWLATGLPGSPCGDEGRFGQRVADLVDAVRSLEQWQKAPKKFVFIDTDFRVKFAFGPELSDFIKYNKATLASADRKIGHKWGSARSVLPMPYRAHFLLDRAAADFADAEGADLARIRTTGTWPMTQEDLTAVLQRRRQERHFSFHADADPGRNIPYTFHGNVNHRRHVAVTITDGIANTSVHDVVAASFSPQDFKSVSMETAETMLRSKFCFVLDGDTPSTRRLFDALAAGCVPILLWESEQTVRNLPFPNTIKWGDFVIFGGDVNCAEQRASDMTAWLKDLLEDSAEKVFQVEQTRTVGRFVFARYLSYQAHSMVNAILGEFAENGTLIYGMDQDIPSTWEW